MWYERDGLRLWLLRRRMGGTEAWAMQPPDNATVYNCICIMPSTAPEMHYYRGFVQGQKKEKKLEIIRRFFSHFVFFFFFWRYLFWLCGHNWDLVERSVYWKKWNWSEIKSALCSIFVKDWNSEVFELMKKEETQVKS